MAWEYKREESKKFDLLPVGDYRIRIESAEKAVSKNGNDMLTFKFEVSGHNNKIFHNITFLKDNVSFTNQKLTEFFDSFKDIPEGEFDTSKWIGKVGACRVKHEEYNGNVNAKVNYFIRADKQDKLPAWVEPENATKGQIPGIESGEFMNVPEGVAAELPF